MPSPDQLRQRIEDAIPGASAEVTGDDGVHFQATVTAEAFRGLSRVQQHKLVYDVFPGELGGEIHALSLRTQTP